ncbi:MAG: TIGR04283 family arsenosugar biosynthesis glycosyltransferase [Flavobacteriaceae bacterium]|nr:TIGR04283 family arsenosugar biosynthesis glycosyltransferase [Flavobacteriaceae bacterium]
MISIIIPVLNEASTIGVILQDISEKASGNLISEIIIVDGGSEDTTLEKASKFAKVLPLILLTSQKGRAKQMNMGAKNAKGEILYFLHADTLLPYHFDSQIISHIKKGSIAGCFRMKFDSHHPILKISQWFTKFNLKSCRGGDQSLFISKKAFENLGGYNEDFTVYEDCEFINRIYDQYRFTIIKDYVITSARKYHQKGTLKLQYHFAMIHIKKWLGASPKNLTSYYKKYILT